MNFLSEHSYGAALKHEAETESEESQELPSPIEVQIKSEINSTDSETQNPITENGASLTSSSEDYSDDG